MRRLTVVGEGLVVGEPLEHVHAEGVGELAQLEQVLAEALAVREVRVAAGVPALHVDRHLEPLFLRATKVA